MRRILRYIERISKITSERIGGTENLVEDGKNLEYTCNGKAGRHIDAMNH